MKMAEDMSQYKDVFLSEAKENLENLNNALLKLEKSPSNPKYIEEIFRNAHTLKSSAAAMKYNKISELCHTMEDVFDEIKHKKRKLTPEIIELFFECFDNLDLSLRQIADGKEEVAPDILISKLKQVLSAKPEKKVSEKVSQDVELAQRPEAIEKITEIKVKVETLDKLMNLIEELLVQKMRLDQLHSSKKHEEMESTLNALGRLVSDLQYNITQARMVPVKQIFNRFPRMLRDLAKKEGKQVNLIMEGGDIELDRTVIDKLGEPLVHLLRNAVDHGIETAETRTKRKKPETGTIRLTAKREKNFAVISVEDDGNGLSSEKIKQTAVRKGIISKQAAEKLTHEAVIKLLCDSKFSTAEKVTKVSGRGVGMNVVKTMIDSLGGILDIDYEYMKGMKVTLKLPLTLAIIKALLAKVGEETYAIPSSSIVRSVRVKPESIKRVINREMVILDKGSIPLIRLAQLFNISTEEQKGALMVIVKKGNKQFGLGVSTLIADQDIIIKPLDKMTRKSKGFAGFTILGDGRAVLILDINTLI